jgi:hypothetical protein
MPYSEFLRSEIDERPDCFLEMRIMPVEILILFLISKLLNVGYTFMEHLQAAHAMM